MKEKLSIGEFAKLRNVTTETLRYYDRIGLLKPMEIDTRTGYRYYSILQVEKLGTIKELRQLGMSIEEILDYFDNRNLDKSLSILKERYITLKEKIEELKILEKSIKEKVEHLEDITAITQLEDIKIKEIEERTMVIYDRKCRNELEVGYACSLLEKTLKGVSPIVGTNHYGIFIKEESLLSPLLLDKKPEAFLGVFLTDKQMMTSRKIEHIQMEQLLAGTYACMYHRIPINAINKPMQRLQDFIKEKGYEIIGDAVQIVQVDVSVTDQAEEELFELQIPIKINPNL